MFGNDEHNLHTLVLANTFPYILTQRSSRFLYSIFICHYFILGAAYGHAEHNVRTLIEKTGVPFLPSPMGKGVVPDDHPQCVIAARSR